MSTKESETLKWEMDLSASESPDYFVPYEQCSWFGMLEL